MRAALLSCLLLSLQARDPRAAASPSGAPTAVTGAVVDTDGSPIPGQVVLEGGHRAETDVDGRFTLPDVPGRYDLTILTPRDGRVTIYRGLSRRDPTLRHQVGRRDPPTRHAKISGVLSDGGPSLLFRFVSARVPTQDYVDPKSLPPRAWALELGWDGPETISGYVIGLGLGSGERYLGAGSKAWFAQAPLTIRDGEEAKVAPEVKEVPVLKRPAPVLDMDGNYPLPDSPHEAYRMPGVGWVAHGGGPFGLGYPAYGPDLSPFGISWCTFAAQWSPYIRTGRDRCGGSLATPVKLYLKAGPKFLAPKRNTPASPGLRFAWSTIAGGVYMLELSAQGKHSTLALPRIAIYTASTSERWPDLSALGLSFPKARASYEVSVTALGPFATLDQAMGPDGLTATARKDDWWAESQDLFLPVRAPLRPDVAACQYPAGESVVCGKLPNGDREFYVLSAINNKIAEYPRFADAIGISCVRDCATARAYLKGYYRYLKENPGFDDDQMLGDIGDTPPLPRNLQRKRTRTR